jgi:hypothetical protein
MATRTRPPETIQAEGAPCGPSRSRRVGNRAGEWRARLREWPWPALAIFFGAAVCAGLFILLGELLSGRIPFEAAKAGIQLLAVAILGGAVAWAFRWLDDRREQRRRLDDYRVKAIADLQDAYHQAKTVRRALRAAGFDKAGAGMRLTADQASTFHTRMEQLDDARTALEKLVDIPHGWEWIYGPDHAAITGAIDRAEKYLGKITKVWEKEAVKIREDADLASIAKDSALQGFLDDADAHGGIKESLSEPIRDARKGIQALRFGGPGRGVH